MQCPLCKAKMEEGYIDRSIWISGKYNPIIKISSSIVMWPLKRKTECVIAWKCPNCNKIELVASK